MELEESFEDRTVFITGACGFIGSHVAEELIRYGADVHITVHPVNGMGKAVTLKEDVTVHRCDLGDRRSVMKAIGTIEDKEDVIVLHLAAQADVGSSWDRPYETIRSNVTGTLNVLDALVEHEVDLFKFSNAATSEMYGNPRDDMREYYRFNDDGTVLLDERTPLNPKSIYATTKAAGEHLAFNYRDAYGLPVVSLRMFNNFGPRQDPRDITGTVITQALERNVVELGNLEPKRDFTFVRDGALGHLYASLYGNSGERYAAGYGETISMKDWVNLILKVGRNEGYWGHVTIEQDPDRYRPGDSEVQELLVDNSKLSDETGWEPRFGWEDGLSRTIEWYTNNPRLWRGKVDWR